MIKTAYDAVIVGAGPNGLTAAAVLARAGLSVAVFEANDRIGGGARTEALTLTGFSHDVCSAIHPMGILSPIFRRLQLESHGLRWLTAAAPLAHPLDDGRAAVLSRDPRHLPDTLGVADAEAWRQLIEPFVEQHEELFAEILKPLRVPRHPWLMGRFGGVALQAAVGCAERHFTGDPARALFAGCAAHSFVSLHAPGSASFGLVLAVAGHAVNWPCAAGGSQSIADALVECVKLYGGEIHTGMRVRTLADLPSARAVLFDVTPRQLDAIARDGLSASYRRRLRAFQYGPGVFKIDYALAGPIPWRAVACGQAATVHLGGTYDEIARAEEDAIAGRVPESPFVLIAQQSLFDPSRAPAPRHTGWAYCHVPHGCTVNMTDRVERQIERFAPGFRDLVLARHVMSPAALEAHNANAVGGDIGGGSNTLSQFITRPFPRWDPYTTSNPRLYLCSSSTPPGGGVHGMCGYGAARSALRHTFKREVPAELNLTSLANDPL